MTSQEETALRPSRFHKQIRLPPEAYREVGSAWHVTIGTANREPVFADLTLGADVAAMIEERCAKRRVMLDAYCLMPDHAHLIIQIASNGVGLVDAVRDFKSCTTRTWWAHGGKGPLWQKSFHDHGLRTIPDYEKALTYLFENPIRAGLVEDWLDYPLIGGTMITGNEIDPGS